MFFQYIKKKLPRRTYLIKSKEVQFNMQKPSRRNDRIQIEILQIDLMSQGQPVLQFASIPREEGPLEQIREQQVPQNQPLTKSAARSNKSKKPPPPKEEEEQKKKEDSKKNSQAKKTKTMKDEIQMQEELPTPKKPQKLSLTDRASLRKHIYNLSEINNSIKTQIALKIRPFRSKEHHTPYLYIRDQLQEKKASLSLDLIMLKDTQSMILNLFQLAFEVSPQTGEEYRINGHKISAWISQLLTQQKYGIQKVGNAYLNYLLEISELQAEKFLREMVVKYLYLVNEKLTMINFEISLQAVPRMLFHQVLTPFTEESSKYNSSVYNSNSVPVLPYKAYSVTMMSKIYQQIINISQQHGKKKQFDFYSLRNYYDVKLGLIQSARTNFINSEAYAEYQRGYIYQFYNRLQLTKEATEYFMNVNKFESIIHPSS